MQIDDIKKIAKDIGGWLDEREGVLLYKLAKQCRQGVIVEIGSYKGRSTVWLGQGSLAGSKPMIYAVDPHTFTAKVDGEDRPEHSKEMTTYDEFIRNIKAGGVDSLVKPMVTTSQEAAKNWKLPVGLLWIDGDHSYEGVKQDVELWEPHLIDGGVIAFHDSFGEPVKRLLREKIYGNDHFYKQGVVEMITYATKSIVPIGFFKKIKGRLLVGLEDAFVILRKLPWPFRSFFQKIGLKMLLRLREV
jgi:hypothetical protein